MTEELRGERDPLGLLPEFHRSTRMPLDAVVRLHFEGTVAYQNGFAANVSALGMFVKHPDPPPVGTRLVFEFVLGEERKPVQGAGVVTWSRERYEGPGRSAGVGIRFTELDALSRQHIAEALFEFLETQLGVEVADHPDVPDLLAAIPRPSALEVGEDGQLDLPEAEPEAPALTADEPVEEAKPTFRLFGDEASPLDERFGEPAGEPATDLFAPVVPPEFDERASEGPTYASVRRSGPSLWVSFGIPIAVMVVGFAGWWYWLGPGAEARQAASAESAPSVEPASQPAPRSPLDPSPGPQTTLAENVGATPLGETTASDGGEPTEAATEEPESESPAAELQTPEPAPAPSDATRFTRISDIRWQRIDGGTEVVLTGDGAIPAGSYRWFEIRGDKPRVLVRLTGVAAGYPRSSLDARTPELAGVRVGFHQKPAGNELHVVLDLASSGVEVESVAAAGGRLTVQLRGG